EHAADASIGVIEARVGADVPMTRLGDQHAFCPQHADALVEDNLDHARVGTGNQPRRDAHRLVAGRDGREVDQPALSFGHRLLRDHEHVAGVESCPGADQRSQIVPGPHLRQPVDADQLEMPHTAGLMRARSAGSSRSSASASDWKTTNLTPCCSASARNWASDSSPKWSPIAPGGRRYRALVPPRPVAGAATTPG